MMMVAAFLVGGVAGAAMVVVSLGAQSRWSIDGVLDTLMGQRLFVDVSGDEFVVPVDWDWTKDA